MAAEHGQNAAVTITHTFGNVVHEHRMDGAARFTAISTAELKAKTARLTRRPPGLRQYNVERNPNEVAREFGMGYFPTAGGLPIWAGKQIIGFIGFIALADRLRETVGAMRCALGSAQSGGQTTACAATGTRPSTARWQLMLTEGRSSYVAMKFDLAGGVTLSNHSELKIAVPMTIWVHGTPFRSRPFPDHQVGDAATALRNTVDLARHAEQWGYRRYWLAEHHNMPGIASAATSIVIGHVAGATNTIRVGAGGIMLPNHSPLIIAEQFGTLATLYPGRIDLGVGRAPGTDQRTMRALRRNLIGDHDAFPQEVLELIAYLGPLSPRTSRASRSRRRIRSAGLDSRIKPLWRSACSRSWSSLRLRIPFRSGTA
jgi:hypothetical protein